jgi:hypothetical protein
MNQTGMMSLLGLAAKLAGAMSVMETFSLPQSFSRAAGVPVALIAWSSAGVSRYSLRSALPARWLPVFAVSPSYRGKRRCLFIQALLCAPATLSSLSARREQGKSTFTGAERAFVTATMPGAVTKVSGPTTGRIPL